MLPAGKLSGEVFCSRSQTIIRAMSKKELRLAVVIYGGASLAIYMHGVTKELLKLVRASKVLHEMGVERAANSTYAEGPDNRAADTEAVYFELLKQINLKQHFRVVVDVIAFGRVRLDSGRFMQKTYTFVPVPQFMTARGELRNGTRLCQSVQADAQLRRRIGFELKHVRVLAGQAREPVR